MLTNKHLTKLTSPQVDVKSYQHVISALMYPMLGTCPDLTYTVAALGRHAANPGEEHLHALDCAFRYLRATSNQQLIFQRGLPGGTDLHGYVDADWASDINDHKSTSSYVFMLAGGAVSWSSKKQASVALLSTEAEYIAGMHAAKEAVWLKRLLRDIWQQPNPDAPVPLLIDNQSAIAIARNPKFHDQTKHIEIQYHFLRQQYESKALELTYVPTGDQVADVLTKALAQEKHQRFTANMGMRHVG